MEFEGINIIELGSLNDGNDNKFYPMFVDPDNNNFDLMENSPLINNGDKSLNNIPDKDINYNNRICGGQVDIGAFEFQTPESINETEKYQLYSIYPNPIDNQIFISGKGDLNISIYNSLGQIFYSDKIQDEVIINTNEWTHGIYIIHINGNAYKVIK